MVKQKTLIGALVVIVAGGFAYQAGVGPLSAAGGPGDDTGAQTDDDLTGAIDLKAKDADADSLNYVAANYVAFNNDGVEIASGTTAANTFESITGLTEGDEVTIATLEDDDAGSDFYYSRQTVTVPETTEQIITENREQGSAAVEVEEDVGTEDDGTISLNQGQTEQISLEISANTADASVRQPAVFYEITDDTVVEEVEINGQEVSAEPDRLSTDGGAVVGPEFLSDFDEETVSVNVQLADDAASAASTTVDFTVADNAFYRNDDGEYVQGYEDDEDADIGVADATTSLTVQNAN